jgi:hypothetical protein
LKTFWQMGAYFGFFMGIFFAFQHGWEEGLLGGALSGFFFGLFMGFFAFLGSIKYTRNRPLNAAEKLIDEGPANYLGDFGWIYLTDSRLFYVSPKLSLEPDGLSFPLSDIVSAETNRTFGFLTNKLTLHLRNGKREEFVSLDARSWVSKIKSASKLSLEAPRENLYL